MEGATASFNRTFASAITKYDEKANERFTAIECFVASLSDNHDKLARQQQELATVVRKLADAMAVAESSIPPGVFDPAEIDRAVDGTSLRI